MDKIVLQNHQLKELSESLHYLKMEELRELCNYLHIPFNGTKLALIDRILTFVQTGEITQERAIPSLSKAKKGTSYPLAPSTLMLHGSYKNDAVTRAFFQRLIGDYFHFTAFGIDWLKERWLAGTPPTYQEFADFWKEEYVRRKQKKVEPKKEWAYINFVQRFIHVNPNASKDEVMTAWHTEREKHVKNVKRLLKLSFDSKNKMIA